MRSTAISCLVASAFACSFGACTASAQVSFRRVGTLQPDQSSFITAISADGTTPVGWVYSPQQPNQVAVRWTPTGTDEFQPEELYRRGVSTGVSGDGSVAVGQITYNAGHPAPIARAFRAVGPDPLFLDGLNATDNTNARAITPDGAIVVGDSAGVPCYWEGFSNPVALPVPSGTNLSVTPTSISADGRRIAGNLYDVGNIYEMVVWTDGAGPERIPVPFDRVNGLSVFMSSDGNSLIGTHHQAFPVRQGAFVWTEPGGFEVLADAYSVSAASADASVIGGLTSAGRATLWIDGELVDVATLLEANGVDLSGWRLLDVTAISADGRTIAGTAQVIDGLQRQGWVAVIPGPGAGAVLVLGLGQGVCGRRRRGA